MATLIPPHSGDSDKAGFMYLEAAEGDGGNEVDVCMMCCQKHTTTLDGEENYSV